MNTHHRPRALGFAAGLLATAGVLFTVGSAAAQQSTPPVRLDANREGWTNVGVTLAQGDRITLSPSGSAGWEPGIDVGPGGGGGSTCQLTIADAPVGSLLARVGTATPVIVREAVTLAGPGPVSLMYNDCPGKYFDNVGGFVVAITLIPAPSAATPAPTQAAAATAGSPVATAAPQPTRVPVPAAEVRKSNEGWGIWPLVFALLLGGAGYGVVRYRRLLRNILPYLVPRRVGILFPESARLESSAWLAPVRLRLIQQERRRTELTIGGPDQDIDFGLHGPMATLIPREDGTVRLNVIPSSGRVLIDGVAVILGQRLNDGSRVHMGTREFIFRLDADAQATSRRSSHEALNKVDPRAAAIAEAAERHSA